MSEVPRRAQSLNATTDSRYKTWGLAGLLLIAYVIMYLMPLGQRPLFIPDETRYAEIPREILSSGDWVVPRLDGLRYFEKPPLGYWLGAASIAAFGENPWAVRWPSACAAGLTGLLIFWFATVLGGRARVGLLAAAIYLCSIEVFAIGTFSVLDSLLTFFLSASIVAFYAAAEGQRLRVLLALIAGFSAGGAFLTKGFLGLLIPALVLGLWLLMERRLLKCLPLIAMAMLAAFVVITPWAVLIHLRESEFWNYFIFEEHLKRFLAEDAQHARPAYYYFPLLPLLAFPWLNLLPAAVAGARSSPINQRQRSAWRLVGLWLVLPLIFFSISRGKLITYILPIFPALAICVGVGLSHYVATSKGRLVLYGVLANAAMLFLLLAGFAFSVVFDFDGGAIDIGNPAFLAFISALLIAAGATVGLAILRGTNRRLIAVSLLTIMPILVLFPYAIPDSVLLRKSPGRLLAPFAERITADTLIIADGGVIRAVGWYFKRADVYVMRPGELAHGLSFPDSTARNLTPNTIASTIANHEGGALVMVCKRQCPSWALTALPASATETRSGPFAMWSTLR